MEMAVIILITLETLILFTFLGLLIYFIVRRIEKKKQETFEHRDN